MKKRKRKEVEEGEINQESGESRGSSKKAKIGVDPLKKFLSLVEAGDSAAGLTYFLTTVQREEDATLIGAYLLQCPSGDAVLAPLQWERDKQTADMMLLCFECLEAILLYTASLQSQSDSGSRMGQSPGHKLVGAILRDHMRPLYSALMTSCPMRLVGACLRLLTAMVMQGHTAARDVQQTFNFAYKPLIVFPNRTNRIKGTSDSVRTCFIKYALSFLIAGDNDVIRNILQLKKFLSSVFKLLPDDPVEMVHLFLSTLREKVLRNGGVSKRAKSVLFNHYALKQLSCLLSLTGPGGETTGTGAGAGKRERRGEELEMVSESSGELVVVSLRDYVLEVLTELCTSFQHGVCYRTKTDRLLAGRTNNSAILQLLLSLTGSLCEPGVQSLVSTAISTCPDLLAPYLGAVGLSFEPRPNSKWIDNVDFLNRLLRGLPPVPETLGIIGGCGQEIPASLVPAAVSLTVPAAISRAFLNQGVQNPSPLVRLKTLDLIRGILKRAVATAASLSALGPSIPPGSGEGATGSGEMSPSVSFGPTASVATTYSDSVLKLLPELKTLVNLRQTLHQGMMPGVSAASSLKQAKASDSFSAQHRLDDAGLLEDPSGLLTGCLEVMRGYQTLSPSLFLQADFNPVRLLPSLAHLATDRATPVPPSVLTATLRLLEEIPSDLVKWQQQKSGVLSSLLWLVVCDSRDIYDVALRLTLKLLLSVECLSQLEVELGLVLTAARRFTDLCLPDQRGCGEGGREEGARKHFVEMLTEVFLTMMRDPQQFTKFQQLSETSDSTAESLTSILDGQLDVPTVEEVVASLSGGHSESHPPSICPLLLSVILGMDCEKYFPFMCDVVLKLLLGQSNPQISRDIASLLLSLADKWRTRTWQGLCQSLGGLLQCWTGSSYTDEMEVDDVVSEVGQLSSRKCVKKLTKMTTAGAVRLLTSVSREVFIDCAIATAKRPHLRQTLLYCLELRPLQLPVYRDNPAVRELLPSLPLPPLVLQCLQLEPTLSLSLAHLPVQQWEESLRSSVEEGDWFGVSCATRTISSLLQQIYSNGNVDGAPVADVCFDVLELILKSLPTPEKVPEAATNQQVAYLLSGSSFGSLLTDSVFTSPLVQSLLGHRQAGVKLGEEEGEGEEWREKGEEGVGEKAEGMEVKCLKGLGRLLPTALVACEEFRTSPLLRRLFLGILDKISVESCEETNGALLDVVERVRPHLDFSLLTRGIECVLNTLTLSPSPPPHLTRALLTLLSPPPHSSPVTLPAISNTLRSSTVTHNSVPSAFQRPSSGGDVPVRCPSNEPHSTLLNTTNQKVNPITKGTISKGNSVTRTKNTVNEDFVSTKMSESSLRRLLEATLRPGCSALTEPALAEVCSRLTSTPPILTKLSAANLDSGYDCANTGYSDSGRSSERSEEGEFLRQLKALTDRTSLKGLCPPFLLRGLHVSRRSNTTSESWLPDELLYRLLENGVNKGASLARCTLTGCFLLHLPRPSLEYFSTACLPGLCGRVASGAVPAEMAGDGEEGSSLETALFSLCLYLTALARHRDNEADVDWCKESSGTVCKLVWKKCSSLIPTSHHLIQWPTIQGLSVRILCLLCQLTSKARKKVKRLAQSWDVSDTPWTRHQLCVVGEAGCAGDGDAGLCVMAARRILSQPDGVSPQEEREGEREVELGDEEEREKDWVEESAPLLCRLWVVLKSLGFGEEEPLDIPVQKWNSFSERSTRGGVKLSLVLGCLCAGVKVLYAGRDEGRRGEEGRKRKKKDQLVSLNSIHSTLWDHSEFRDILYATSNSPQTLAAKESAVELLVYVTERCSDVVSAGHVPTLLGAYSASCSKTDRGLLYLLFLYEVNGANLSRFRPYLWGEAGREVEVERRSVSWLQWGGPPSSRQVLESLDPLRMDTSLNHFPQHSPLEPVDPFSERGDDGRCGERGEELLVYDPAFLLPLASHLLDPGGLVEVREVVRTGVLSYLLVSLSSRETDVRRAAAHCLSLFSSHLRSSSSREKPQLSLLLRVVKNTLDEEPQRLPSLHALFLARVAQVFLQPECQLYMKAGHYLVHKPTLELRDIPLFNALFLHTTSPQDIGECEWLLRVLGGGLRCEEDYRLYQRKRVLPHLLALYTGLSLDSKTRTLILELVLRACVFPVAVCDLVWNHGLLPWLTQATSCSDLSVVQRILSKACKLTKLVEGEDSDSDRGRKPPPLLEEELSLTTARFM